MTADDDARAVEVLAALAALEVPEGRLAALATALTAASVEHGELRSLPPALEAHLVFDPRWD
jgi:hypothetical protein